MSQADGRTRSRGSSRGVEDVQPAASFLPCSNPRAGQAEGRTHSSPAWDPSPGQAPSLLATFFFLLFFPACSFHSAVLLFSLCLLSPPSPALCVTLLAFLAVLPHPRARSILGLEFLIVLVFFFFSPSFGRSLSMMQEE